MAWHLSPTDIAEKAAPQMHPTDYALSFSWEAYCHASHFCRIQRCGQSLWKATWEGLIGCCHYWGASCALKCNVHDPLEQQNQRPVRGGLFSPVPCEAHAHVDHSGLHDIDTSFSVQYLKA